MHMPSLYSYFTGRFKSLPWKLWEKLQRHEPWYAICIMQKFYVNPGQVTLALNIWSEFCDLYAHAQPIFLLYCKFQIIILKTVGDVTETRTVLCHVYKAKFLSKSRVHNSITNTLITVLWPFCRCPVFMLTMVQVPNHYLENCRRSCETRPVL